MIVIVNFAQIMSGVANRKDTYKEARLDTNKNQGGT